MRFQEVRCFADRLECSTSAIQVFDLLRAAPSIGQIDQADVVLLGGSGHYSAAGEGEWLERALEIMRRLHDLSKPTFASCWGFQAMARALGGRCINDRPNAEVGTIEVRLTEEGKDDPIFRDMPTPFLAQAGHEDHVVQLPPDAILLASSGRVPEQAFRFRERPIYCTQFHPELDRTAILERVAAYPQYVESIAGMSFEKFHSSVRETPEANSLLLKFVASIFS